MNKVASLMMVFLLVSCQIDFDPKSNKKTGSDSRDEMSSNNPVYNELRIDVSGLEHMKGQHYEGWLIVGGSPLSTGRFNITTRGEVAYVNADGEILKHSDSFSYQLKSGEMNPQMFVLTIEPNGDTEESPSSVHLVAAEFNNGQSIAVTSHPAALDASFNNISGSYILATPSNGPTTHDQGIWFLNPAIGEATLNLPVLAEGWAYEGWVVDTDTGAIVSTGTFMNVDDIDSDRAGGPKAGPLNQGPEFPGQDFINPGVKLNDGKHMTVISVEPYPDYDARPFSMKPLRQLIPQDAPVTTLLNMGVFNQEGFPTVRAFLR